MLIVITQAYIHLGRTGVDGNNLHTNQELQNKNRKFKCFQMKKKMQIYMIRSIQKSVAKYYTYQKLYKQTDDTGNEVYRHLRDIFKLFLSEFMFVPIQLIKDPISSSNQAPHKFQEANYATKYQRFYKHLKEIEGLN